MSDIACRCCEKNRREKASWGPGPWQDEPDRVPWEHAGLPCILRRNLFGAWCGYVGVPPGHPCRAKIGRDAETRQLDAHGGITYTAECHGCVCHEPKPGEAEDLWWLGFDCAHAGDTQPALDQMLRRHESPSMLRFLEGDHYWTLAEVKVETERLAEQLAVMGAET